ncbi:MAG: helix-turn-helix transcriptional regulator [Rubrobacter sp.]|nr:helix-turn-helix transcriptional regulator [Rubrobacter sp.]
MVRRADLEVLEGNAVGNDGSYAPDPTLDSDVSVEEKRFARLAALGRALSDPIRVRMLGLMATAATEGRGCCDLPDLGVPASIENTEEPGICVCEFEDIFGMGQSKVSYHVRKLKDAGLVREERRGKWNFYSLDKEAARKLLHETGEHLGAFSSAD